ncbi:hypothetical protein GJ496_006357 [Pomphorhynchus laevis]|nr:hypothetical protein GJ496_006357 [Pomphorhynchus laevis]
MLVLLVGSLVPVSSIASAFEQNSTKSSYDEAIISESRVNSRAREGIYANHFVIGVNEVGSITDAKLKQLSSVMARDLDTGQAIAVTGVDHDIKPKQGKYEVKFSTDKPTEVTVFATVYGGKIENSSPTFDEFIAANNFHIGLEEVKNLTDEKLKYFSQVIAEDNNTWEILTPDVSVIANEIQPKQGDYNVSFATPNGTKIDVIATVYSESVFDPTKNERISSSDFEIYLSEVASLNDDKLILLANASAFNYNDFENVSVRILNSNIVEDIGTYNVTYISKNDVQVTVKATVKADPIVSYESNGGTAVSSEKVEVDKLVTKPTDPVKAGHTFVGWYKDANLQNEWDFDNDKMPDNPITLYAKWSQNFYQIKFDSNTGIGTMPDVNVNQGDTLALTRPSFTKEGYRFKNWNTKADGTGTSYQIGDLFNPTTVSRMLVKDITLYAQWSVDKFDVSYDSNGGTAVNPDIVEFDTLVTKPTNPTRAGHTFIGWYTEDGLINEWDFALNKMPAKDITLYAKWSVNRTDVPVAPQAGTDNTLESTGLETNLVAMTSIVMMLIMLVATRVFLKRK